MSLRVRRARAAAGEPAGVTIDDRLRRSFRVLRAAIGVMAVAGIVTLAYDGFIAQPAARQSASAQRGLLRANAGMLDQETGLRGWLLTGDRTFLGPYDQGLSEVQRGDAQLRAAL
ncbi:MAG: CHASE3 domain-containing protein, partial [Acidimicrobiales bacterium]